MKAALTLLAAGLALAACASTPQKGPPPQGGGWTFYPPMSAGPQPSTVRDLGRYFDCLRENNITIAAAHRLGGGGSAENSLGAMSSALQSAVRGAPAIMELDIRQTSDGALVVMHDETVDRTTNGAGRVDEMTEQQFSALRLKPTPGQGAGAEAPPTMAQALERAKDGGVVLQLDVKRGAPFEDVVKAVQNAGAQNRAIVIVYSLADAITVHNIDPTLMLSVAINSEEELDTLARVGVDLSRVLAWTGVREPSPALYQTLRRRGVEVLFGTLGPPGQSIDSQIEQNRTPRRYVEIARTGVTMISTGRFRAATEALLEGGVGDPRKCVSS